MDCAEGMTFNVCRSCLWNSRLVAGPQWGWRPVRGRRKRTTTRKKRLGMPNRAAAGGEGARTGGPAARAGCGGRRADWAGASRQRTTGFTRPSPRAFNTQHHSAFMRSRPGQLAPSPVGAPAPVDKYSGSTSKYFLSYPTPIALLSFPRCFASSSRLAVQGLSIFAIVHIPTHLLCKLTTV